MGGMWPLWLTAPSAGTAGVGGNASTEVLNLKPSPALSESLWTCQANSHFLGMVTIPKLPWLLGLNLLMH